MRPTAARPAPAAAERSDLDLVEAIRTGDQAAFTTLYERYFDRVYHFAYARLRHRADAEEVAQETFVAVFRSIDAFVGRSALLSWIYGIAKNTINNHLRRARAQELRIERDLTPLQRRIFHLKHLRRQSIRTIARALGKSEDAIKANLYRMRMALAQSAPGLESLIAQ